MSITLSLADEIRFSESPDFVPGEYLYLGQIKTADGQTAVLSVGYKPGYAARKLRENLAILQTGADIRAYYLRKIRVGEMDDCGKIPLP